MYIGFNGGVKLSWILFQRHIPSIKLFCFERRKKLNDPTQFEQVDETCEFGGAVLYSESLGITAFFENAVPSKYETQKLKQLQFGIENEKIRQFEHECLIRLFQWSFLPPSKALDFSVCDEAFGCYKTQYRKRYLLEICQNASFLSTPDRRNSAFRMSDRKAEFFFRGQAGGAYDIILSGACS